MVGIEDLSLAEHEVNEQKNLFLGIQTTPSDFNYRSFLKCYEIFY